MKLFRNSIFILAVALISSFLVGCAQMEAPDYRDNDYGYVQFKLYKEASYPGTKAVMSQLEYLKDVCKVMVTLRFEGKLISQTLVMSASDDQTAEFGLRSEKLKLVVGKYQLISYALYDKLDEKVYENSPKSDMAIFEVVAGGLHQHDLLADVTPRGQVRFTLKKDFKAANTKAAEREYTFDEIKYASITVRDDNGVQVTFSELPTKFSIHFDDNDDTFAYQVSTSVCDSLVTLKAGNYKVISYSVYHSKTDLLEFNNRLSESTFVVEDNKVTEADVPVKLYESDDHIKDYVALRDIWVSLNGPKWSYKGEDYSEGVNWNFNKDIDLWGDQPGVSLHPNGRVAALYLSNFAFHGHMSPALGQLTELAELELGAHNDTNRDGYNPSDFEEQSRMNAQREYLRRKYQAVPFSEPIARALMEHNISIPEIAMYETMKEDELIDKVDGRPILHSRDISYGVYHNGLLSLPEEIKNLKKLFKLYIANGKITSLPEGLTELEACTDIEVYNCPDMKEFPTVLTRMPSLVLANISQQKQWSEEDINAGLKALASGASAETIQILYINGTNLSVVPKEISGMKKLALLDLANNQIHTIEAPFGKDVKLVQCFLDNNKLTSFPATQNGETFFGVEDMESFSASNNLLTEVPDLFSAKSIYGMGSVNFSNNKITKFPDNYKGIYVSTLSLNNNPIKLFPSALKTSNSIVANLNLRGCGLEGFEENCFDYENALYFSSLDLSYNKLSDLPADMHAGNMPYFYGIDLSYNRFSKFPYEPLDARSLTVFGIRCQRNAEGKRCLSEWPTGIYQHVGLRGFYIGSNNLGKIDDTISSLCYYLDISDNPNIVFDASDICDAWKANMYYLIYDKTQDIRGCELMLY